MFIESSFIITKTWQQPSNESEWVNELWFIHTMADYSVTNELTIDGGNNLNGSQGNYAE